MFEVSRTYATNQIGDENAIKAISTGMLKEFEGLQVLERRLLDLQKVKDQLYEFIKPSSGRSES